MISRHGEKDTVRCSESISTIDFSMILTIKKVIIRIYSELQSIFSVYEHQDLSGNRNQNVWTLVIVKLLVILLLLMPSIHYWKYQFYWMKTGKYLFTTQILINIIILFILRWVYVFLCSSYFFILRYCSNDTRLRNKIQLLWIILYE